jgi:hypothetical protein
MLVSRLVAHRNYVYGTARAWVGHLLGPREVVRRPAHLNTIRSKTAAFIHIQRNDTIRGIFDWHTFRERFAQTQDDWMLLKPQLGYLIGLPVANERVVPTFANRHTVIVSVANSRTMQANSSLGSLSRTDKCLVYAVHRLR